MVLPDPSPRAKGLRVLVATNVYPSPRSPETGIFVFEQVEALRRRTEIARIDVLHIDGLRSTANYARGAIALRRWLGQHECDLVHAHWGLTVALAAAQRSVPVLATFHGGDLAYKRWHRTVSRAAARHTALNICVSRSGAALLGTECRYLPCGIELELFRPVDRKAARAAFSVSPESLALLFPSSPSRPVKRHDRFAAVVHELRQRGRQVTELRLDRIAREEVPTLMAAADAMVMTSDSEGSPVSVMEALGCGLPVVSTPVGDVPDMVAQEPRASVLAFERARFADEVLRLVSPAERRPGINAGRFRQEAVVDRLLDAYATAARRRR